MLWTSILLLFYNNYAFFFVSGTYMGANVNWMDSTGKEVTLWQTMMQRPNFWVEGSVPLRPQLSNWKKNKKIQRIIWLYGFETFCRTPKKVYCFTKWAFQCCFFLWIWEIYFVPYVSMFFNNFFSVPTYLK